LQLCAILYCTNATCACFSAACLQSNETKVHAGHTGSTCNAELVWAYLPAQLAQALVDHYTATVCQKCRSPQHIAIMQQESKQVQSTCCIGERRDPLPMLIHFSTGEGVRQSVQMHTWSYTPSSSACWSGLRRESVGASLPFKPGVTSFR